MSIEIIKTQIAKFLETDTPEVMAIKGRWGVGKTYQWNHLLKKAKNNNKIGLNKYSYVSLFGVTSLDAFKYAIFEHGVDHNLIGTEANTETFQTNIASLFKTWGKKSLSFIELLSRIITRTSFTTTIESFAFLSISKTIICIDDLERRGKGLELKDVLGLVTVLKEQRNCKIVLLLNDGEEGLDDYVKYREKVIDIELDFSPTAEENVEIAFKGTDIATQILKESAIKLDIKNIRVLKQIERLVNLVLPYLSEYEPEVAQEAVHSLTLFTWCHYCHKSDKAPPLDYVTNITYFSFLDSKIKNETEEQKNWKILIEKYRYTATDDLDLILAKGVKSGYFIEDEIKPQADKKNKKIIALKSGRSYWNAWDLFNSNFTDSTNEVVNNFCNTIKTNIKHLNPLDLQGIVTLFRELEENEKAEEIIDFYIESRKDEIELFNPDNVYSHGSIIEQSIQNKFTLIFQASVAQETAEQVLERITKSPRNPEDIAILLNTSIDQYVELFKSINDRYRLADFITKCLQFGQISNTTEYKEITNRATEALKRIARESKINEVKVKRFGINLEDEQAGL